MIGLRHAPATWPEAVISARRSGSMLPERLVAQGSLRRGEGYSVVVLGRGANVTSTDTVRPLRITVNSIVSPG